MVPVAFDPAAEANHLANLFYSCSAAVDDLRLSLAPPPSREDMARLKDEAQALDDRAHYFTATAIGATLQAIQTELDGIKALTARAVGQLRELNDVSKAINLATRVLSLGTAIAAGDPATILAAVQALGSLLTT